MSLYTVSSNPSFAEVVNAALKTQSRVCASSDHAIVALLSSRAPKSRIVILDLDTIHDAARLIDFVKSSPPIRDTLMIAAGADRHFTLLDQRTCEALSGILYPPFTATELALIVASLDVAREPDSPL
jgi:hypothetical protein